MTLGELKVINMTSGIAMEEEDPIDGTRGEGPDNDNLSCPTSAFSLPIIPTLKYVGNFAALSL